MTAIQQRYKLCSPMLTGQDHGGQANDKRTYVDNILVLVFIVAYLRNYHISFATLGFHSDTYVCSTKRWASVKLIINHSCDINYVGFLKTCAQSNFCMGFS